VLGVNGQLLMHFAALHRIEWPIEFCEPVPVFAVSCTVARMQIAA
jgi:hypothetical protein